MMSLGGLEWEEAAELSTAPLPTAHRTGGPLPLSTRQNHTRSAAQRPARACQHQLAAPSEALQRGRGLGKGAGLAGVLGEKLSYKKILKDVLDN